MNYHREVNLNQLRRDEELIHHREVNLNQIEENVARFGVDLKVLNYIKVRLYDIRAYAEKSSKDIQENEKSLLEIESSLTALAELLDCTVDSLKREYKELDNKLKAVDRMYNQSLDDVIVRCDINNKS